MIIRNLWGKNMDTSLEDNKRILTNLADGLSLKEIAVTTGLEESCISDTLRSLAKSFEVAPDDFLENKTVAALFNSFSTLNGTVSVDKEKRIIILSSKSRHSPPEQIIQTIINRLRREDSTGSWDIRSEDSLG